MDFLSSLEPIEESIEDDEINDGVMLISQSYEGIIPVSEIPYQKFNLKDILVIPFLDERKIPFRVEHIDDGYAHLVSVNVLGEGTVKDNINICSKLYMNMPAFLADTILFTKHRIKRANFSSSSTGRYFTIPSPVNCWIVDDNYRGDDDILFDGFRTPDDRRKVNKDGEPCSWWLDSNNYEEWDFNYVGVDGNLCSNKDIDKAGLVACFKIKMGD